MLFKGDMVLAGIVLSRLFFFFYSNDRPVVDCNCMIIKNHLVGFDRYDPASFYQSIYGARHDEVTLLEGLEQPSVGDHGLRLYFGIGDNL